MINFELISKVTEIIRHWCAEEGTGFDYNFMAQRVYKWIELTNISNPKVLAAAAVSLNPSEKVNYPLLLELAKEMEN